MRDLIIFFPWSKEQLAVFRQSVVKGGAKKGETLHNDSIAKIATYVMMTDMILKNMNFEDMEEGDDLLASYFSDEIWQILENRNTVLGEETPRNPNWKIAENLKMLCPVNSRCRGWIIDVKKLKFCRLNDHSLELFKGNLKVMKSFDELEKFIEDYKHRFASKKFGI